MQNPTPEQLTQSAQKIALETGKIQLSYLNQDPNSPLSLNIEEKTGHRDIVTAADKACEKYVTTEIQKLYPSHQILGEEGTGQEQGQAILESDQPVWIIDPIDGTTNFSHGHPFFCVSIGITQKPSPTEPTELIAGVVHSPLLNQTFTAWKNGGAFLNGTRIHVSKNANLKKSLLATGFNPQYDAELNIQNFRHFLPLTQGIRRNGAAALDLCFTATGINDGFWEKGLKPWDLAAGVLIIREAGGTVTNLTGGPFNLYTDHILAGNPEIHSQLLDYFKDIQL